MNIVRYQLPPINLNKGQCFNAVQEQKTEVQRCTFVEKYPVSCHDHESGDGQDLQLPKKRIRNSNLSILQHIHAL